MVTRRIDSIIARAEKWMVLANQLITDNEKKRYTQLSHIISRPDNKYFLIGLLDRCFRTNNSMSIHQLLLGLLKRYGTPTFISRYERVMLKGIKYLKGPLTRLSVPALLLKLKAATHHLILSDSVWILIPYLLYRKWKSITVTINRIGERVLGERDVHRFLKKYEEDIRNPQINSISIKLSSLCSTLYPLGESYSKPIVIKRLAALFTLAMKNKTSVILDMEEFRYVYFTFEVFMNTLDSDDFKTLDVGIVIQAYLKDSLSIYQKLYEWAKRRAQSGKMTLRIRLVKGSNLQMESVEASINGWELPIYSRKVEVDANFKRLVQLALSPNHCSVLRVGIGSHNLFDIAFSYEVAKENNVLNYIRFELLEGVANHIIRALHRTHDDVLVYTPLSSDHQFIHSIGYLMRRFDENTTEKHFLRYLFNLKVGSSEWKELKADFLASIDFIKTLKFPPQIHRFIEKHSAIDITTSFKNEPCTDWRIPQNRTWAKSIRKKWQCSNTRSPIILPFTNSSPESSHKKRITTPFYDISLPNNPPIFTVELADQDDILHLLKIAEEDPSLWRSTSLNQRCTILSHVASLIRQNRADLIGMMAAITGKPVIEGDAEVSEAIDFIEFYLRSLLEWETTEQLTSSPIGTGLIISPWNFPLAIPCGGIVASLVGGNTTIIKPSPDSIPIAIKLVNYFWEAGVPKEALQIAPTTTTKLAQLLIQSPSTHFVIFTGSAQTAQKILYKQPQTPLYAETGGKNATIVTALADKEQAIQNVIQSAFAYSGQKCSATSLLILEKELYNDPKFKAQLADAISSIRYGSPWQFENKVTPLVQKPNENLHWALTSLDPGEEWVVRPQFKSTAPPLISPGLKWGVQPGSFMHQTELFGPVLSVMCADSLPHAIQLVNDTGYGLTSGLESLDFNEQQYWKDHIQAGNLYINRETTGATVNQQPFGGIKKSSLGPGIKTGGDFYVTSFVRWSTQKTMPSDISFTLIRYRKIMSDFFTKSYDPAQLLGEHNHTRFLPIGRVGIRITPPDSINEVCLMISAAVITGCLVNVSLELDQSLDMLPETIRQQISVTVETEDQFIGRLDQFDRLRFCCPAAVSDTMYKAAADHHLYIESRSVIDSPKLELLRYLQEQTISNRFHRYGNTSIT
jgi:RHH-type proline utilization regulon transcriptional repressor/proline dehydrogenase/delta 1-pyrroline-5-carboxylate dehydrogenase